MALYYDTVDPDAANSLMSYYDEWAGLPEGTLQSVARIESSYNPETGRFVNGCNRVQACGLMQIRPIALKDIYNRYRINIDPTDPTQAIVGAACMFNLNRRYIRYYTKREPDIFALVAAYNGGWTAGRKYMYRQRLSNETRNYLAKFDMYGVA